MDIENKTKIINWCKQCGVVSEMLSKSNNCIICQGSLVEIGLVEE
jgi:hypothetical protein